MRPLRLHSEVYRPEGSIDARSQRRTLGRPALDFFDLFLRETLQNSWDARTGDGPVHFSIDAWRPTPGQTSLLRDIVFRTTPAQADIRKILTPDLDVLVVTDTGTSGLDGPTRADVATAGATNFVDLVRNTGRDLAKGYGGGTYGFGKAVLFEASACSTVLVYPRTTADGAPTTRFIAMALGEPYKAAGRRYTGRHWWGTARHGMVDPVEGQEAEDLADALGLRRLRPGTTGTSLMVLAPATDGAPLREVVARFAEAATVHAWPHLVPIAGRPPDIVFTFTCGDETFRPPDPMEHPQLRHYVEAYRRCEDLLAGRSGAVHAWPWTVEEVRSQRPDRRLGVLAYRDYPHSLGGSHAAVPADVALMREPRFVVRYLPVKASPTGQATAGVFIAPPELDTEFAASEPASHDDWSPANLGLAPNQRNPVRRALEEIKARFRRQTVPVTATRATHHPGTVNLASRLGRMLDGTVAGTDPRIPSPVPAINRPDEGAGPIDPTGPPEGQPPDPTATGRSGDSRIGRTTAASGGWTGPHTRNPRPRAWLAPTVRIVTLNGAPAVEFTAEIVVPEGSPGATVTAEPYVLIDGGRESEPPAGAGTPQVSAWRETTTGETQTGPVLQVTRPGTSRWQITVSQPADTAVSMRLDSRGHGT